MDASYISFFFSSQERQKRLPELMNRPSILIDSYSEEASSPQVVEPLQVIHSQASPIQEEKEHQTAPSTIDHEADDVNKSQHEGAPMLMVISPEPSPEPYVHYAIREEERKLKWPKSNKIT